MRAILATLTSLMVFFTVYSLQAQQSDWQFSIGGGVCSENVYVGSDEYYVTPVPNLNASYKRGNFDCSLSLLEGLGFTYMRPDLGLIANFTINYGPTRHSEEYSVAGITMKHSSRTKELLKGTTNCDTPYAYNTMVASVTPIGLFGISLGIHPTSVEYAAVGRDGETRTGLLYSAQYIIGSSVTDRLSFSGFCVIEYMDHEYADTWYTVETATSSLDEFTAGAGLRSSMVALEIKYRISERISLTTVGAGTLLLADAKQSPYTSESLQGTIMIQTFYRF